MIRSFLLAMVVMGSAACATTPETLQFDVKQIPASSETAGMPERGDRADDPAVWVNAAEPGRSLILGTNKETGLYVYDLNGKELQFLSVGRLNNIDLRENIAVGSNDEINGLSWFAIDESMARVRHLGDTSVTSVEPYGVCAALIDGVFYASPTYKNGEVEIWQTAMTDVASLSPTLSRTLQLPGQLEGCVYHEASQRLFIGEEENGIWVLDLSDPAAEPTLFDTIASGNGLVADVEGISIWASPDGAQYLLASAQAKDRFVVYDLSTNLPVGIFSVTSSLDGKVDTVTHTDGIDVTAQPLPGYPQGLVVVQDDGNPGPEQNQNFKLVDWSAIAIALGL